MLKPLSDICVFTSILDEDAHYIDQYLHEMERIGLRFGVHFDRCYPSTKCALSNHPLCVGCTNQDIDSIEFHETHKQKILDLLKRKRFRYALALDMDETLQSNARELLSRIPKSKYYGSFECPVWQLWETPDRIRIDHPFGCMKRSRIFPIATWNRLKFLSPVVNGPTGYSNTYQFDLNVLHHGMMTKELRLLHKERWNRIYTKAIGYNPYNFWNHICDESITPEIIPNPYL